MGEEDRRVLVYSGVGGAAVGAEVGAGAEGAGAGSWSWSQR